MPDQPCKNPHCKSYGQPHPNCRCYDGMAKGGLAASACDRRIEHKPNCNYAKGGFALEDETDTHYVLKHPKGDHLKIAKQGLSKEMHANIKKFAKGGEVKNPISEGFINATGNAGIQQGIQNIKNYAGGTPEMPVQPDETVGKPSQEQLAAWENGGALPQGISQPPAQGGFIDPQSSGDIRQGVVSGFHKMLDVLGSGGNQREIASEPQQTVPSGNQVQTTAGYSVPTEDKTNEVFDWAKSKGRKVMDFLNQPITPEGEAQAAAQKQRMSTPANYETPDIGNATPLPSKQQPKTPPMNLPALPTLDSETKQLQDLAKTQRQDSQDMHERAMNVLHDITTEKLDFNRLWSNKSTGNKILAGIGMALSGIGSGITGQPNLAMEMINKEIERDIEQQKAEVGKKATVLDGYIKSYGNKTAGANALREDLQAAVAAKMQNYSLKMQGNMMRGMSGGGGDATQFLTFLQATGSPMAKSVEERLVPSLGGALANRPVPEEALDAISKGQELDQTLGDLEQFSKIHGSSLNPVVVNQGKALAARAKELLRQANKQGVFKESEQKFDETMIPSDPSKFFADYRTLPQYEMMKELNKRSLHNTVGKYFKNNPLNTMPETQQLTQRPGIKTQNVNLRK